MAFGDDITLTYKGADYVIPHNKTMFALARITMPDHAKNEPGIDIQDLVSGNGILLAMAMYRALTFAGADIKDPLEIVHALQTDEGIKLSEQFATIFAKLQPPTDFSGGKGKTKGSKKA